MSIALPISLPALAADLVRNSSSRSGPETATQASSGSEDVTCFAGCVGRRGEVLARVQLPPLSPEAASRKQWRMVAQNMWCHDDFGCRSHNVVPYRRWCYRTHTTIAVYHYHRY